MINDLIAFGQWLPITISTAALVVSLFANRHAKRSAKAAEQSALASQETAQIDRDRRHHQLTPIFDVRSELIPDRGQQTGGMWVQLAGTADLDEVGVQFEKPSRGEAHFVRHVTVADRWTLAPGESMSGEALSVRMGERFSVLFHLDDPDDSETQATPVRLRLECKRAGWDPWTVVVEGETSSWPTVI